MSEPAPLQPSASKPRISILFLAYNQSQTVEAAARSVLAQEAEPLEIILSDDASSDDSFGILQRLAAHYRGPHSVRARRNEVNLGIGQHYNTLVAEAQGQLLVTAAGDDVSEIHRIKRIAEAWDASGQQVDLIASHLVDLDEAGHLGKLIEVDDLAQWPDVDAWRARRPYIVGASHAFTRRLWDRFGPMNTRGVYEDQIITLRALLSGGALTIPEALVQYRRGGASAQCTYEDGAAFLRRSHLLNERSLIEQAQQMADARIAGVEEQVRLGLAVSIAREQLIAALLGEPRACDAIRALRQASSLPLSWRLRKWFYLRWPKVGASVRRMQHLSQRLRRRK